MKITHNPEEHAFVAHNEEGEYMGEIQYMPKGDVLIATHTLTEDRFQGRGVAGKLLNALVEYAVETNCTITPYCSYVVRAFESNPERYRAVIERG